MLRRVFLCWLVVGPGVGIGRAQESAGDFRLALFGGPAFLTYAHPRPLELGISVDERVLPTGSSRAGIGFLAEGGLFHPAISGKGNFYFSVDGVVDGLPREAPIRPFAVAGYTRMFNADSTGILTANAVNFGVGVDRVLQDDLWLRVELREMFTPSSDTHALVVRVGLVGVGSVR
jgi:hypothetical protein